MHSVSVCVGGGGSSRHAKALRVCMGGQQTYTGSVQCVYGVGGSRHAQMGGGGQTCTGSVLCVCLYVGGAADMHKLCVWGG